MLGHRHIELVSWPAGAVFRLLCHLQHHVHKSILSVYTIYADHWDLSCYGYQMYWPITFTIYISLTQSLDSVCDGSDTNLISIQEHPMFINSWPPRLLPWPSTKSALLAAAMICIIHCLGVSLSSRPRLYLPVIITARWADLNTRHHIKPSPLLWWLVLRWAHLAFPVMQYSYNLL